MNKSNCNNRSILIVYDELCDLIVLTVRITLRRTYQYLLLVHGGPHGAFVVQFISHRSKRPLAASLICFEVGLQSVQCAPYLNDCVLNVVNVGIAVDHVALAHFIDLIVIDLTVIDLTLFELTVIELYLKLVLFQLNILLLHLVALVIVLLYLIRLQLIKLNLEKKQEQRNRFVNRMSRQIKANIG